MRTGAEPESGRKFRRIHGSSTVSCDSSIFCCRHSQLNELSVSNNFQRKPNHHHKKTNALSNKASLGTYLTLAFSAGAHSLASHNAHAGIVISTVNQTSINQDDAIFITFINGVISSGHGPEGLTGSFFWRGWGCDCKKRQLQLGYNVVTNGNLDRFTLHRGLQLPNCGLVYSVEVSPKAGCSSIRLHGSAVI